MINFFRKIRKRLADQNKPLKYLRYALGEIVLVMIGILLALQVNNWNEERKDQIELRNILEGIVEDMKKDVREFTWVREEYESENKRISSFLNHQDYSGFTRDSLEQGLETFWVPIELKTNNFDRLYRSGLTNYGKYKDVINEIKLYYEVGAPMIKNLEELDKDNVTKSDNYWRFVQNSYEFNFEDELHSHQTDEAGKAVLISQLLSPKPRNILKLSYRNKKKFRVPEI